MYGILLSSIILLYKMLQRWSRCSTFKQQKATTICVHFIQFFLFTVSTAFFLFLSLLSIFLFPCLFVLFPISFLNCYVYCVLISLICPHNHTEVLHHCTPPHPKIKINTLQDRSFGTLCCSFSF